MLEKWPYNLQNDFHKKLRHVRQCYLRSATHGKTRKSWTNLFFIGKLAFFFEELFWSTCSHVLQKWFYNLHNKWHNTLCILIKCFWSVFYSLKRGKMAERIFSLEREPFSKKNLYFQQTLRCYRNDSIPCIMIAGNLVETSELLPDVCHFGKMK